MSSVLLVDDNRELAFLVKRLLEKRGHTVHLAFSGEEALRHLSNGVRPDIVLLDVIMPGMSGEEVLSCIRSSEKLKDIPVYMFSVLTERCRLDDWLAMGADGYIPKPFDVEWIEEAIRRSARSRSGTKR